MRHRASKTSLLFALAIAGCGPTLTEAVQRSDGEAKLRRPDGVVVDPQSELPATADAAEPDAGLVSLRAQVGEKSARKVVAAFFTAMTNEDMATLFSLFTSDALFRSSREGAPMPSSEAYRARAQRFEYQALREVPIFDEDRVELYRYDDFDAPWELPVARPPGMGPFDVALRVPMTTTHSSTGRLFGDELIFVVRRDGDALRIAGVVEDFLGW